MESSSFTFYKCVRVCDCLKDLITIFSFFHGQQILAVADNETNVIFCGYTTTVVQLRRPCRELFIRKLTRLLPLKRVYMNGQVLQC